MSASDIGAHLHDTDGTRQLRSAAAAASLVGERAERTQEGGDAAIVCASPQAPEALAQAEASPPGAVRESRVPIGARLRASLQIT